MTQDERLNDLLVELMLAEAHGETGALDRFCRENPAHEHELTAYAVAEALAALPWEGDDSLRIEAVMTADLESRVLASARAAFAAEPPVAITGILARAGALGLDGQALASALDLPRDVLLRLDRRLIAAQSVPRRLIAELAVTLQTSIAAVASFLSDPPAVRVAAFNYAPGAPTPPGSMALQTFATALAVSPLASASQIASWQATLRDEGLV
jgi:hypothetical protein